MTIYKVKEYLDGLKDTQQLDYEWSKFYAGSLILKNSSKDLDEIIHLLKKNIMDNIQEKLSFNPFNPAEFGNTKFIIIHKENIESTLDFSNFESKFKHEINDNELINKVDNWIAQIPFFNWKIYALKLLSNITYLKVDKIDKGLEEIKKYISGLNDFVISDIEGIEKSSVHLFYSLNKLIADPNIEFILSKNLNPSDSRSIVFIDDMIGTGHQASKYVKKLRDDGKIAHQKLYYYAIVGLEDGIKEIEKSGLFEDVLTTEKISNTAFDTGYIFTAEESGAAKGMASTIGEQLTEGLDKIGPLGYENSGALVFFGHNSPNNSLPIFWASGKCKILESLGEDTEVNWTPLFPRKEKPKTSKLELAKSESTFVKSTSNVPLQNRFFTGREIYIEKLHEALKSDGAAALSQPQAISGLGGIGKTETAIEYAHKYKDKYKEAEELFNTALNIKKKVLGEDHPDLAATINNLGLLYHNQGKYEKAEEFYNTALDIQKNVFGDNHPDMAITFGNLGSLYHDHGETFKAKNHLKQAVEIVGSSFGKESPLIVPRLINYANFLNTTNWKRESVIIKKQVKAIQKKQKPKKDTNHRGKKRGL